MIKQQLKYYNDKLSGDEIEVIEKFITFYKNQPIIIADEYRQDYSMVPLENEKIIFKSNEDTWKNITIRKRIFHNKKTYIVELDLWRSNNSKEPLSIHNLKVIEGHITHYINLDIKNALKNTWLFNIINIFDERRIISPEQAYCNRMHTNKNLQKMINNQDFEKIDSEINLYPKLANDLFIINEGYESDSYYYAYFGTILYQLIKYKEDKYNEFYGNELLKLEELIYKLRKTELLKVKLQEQITNLIYFENNHML